MADYTIKRGDTLGRLAKKNKTTVAALMKLNPYITNANKIYAGKGLTLSAAPAAAALIPTT